MDLSLQWLRATPELGDVSKPSQIEDSAERKVYTRYTPLGVIGGIVPWNFPVFLMAAKLVSAVITGNTIIFKPSPFTPYCGLKLCELAQQFFPPGVVQCLSGDDDLGQFILTY
jgi:acyl-CoA reductase-like NAD-dependent aldehyde dehydrogenase